MTYQDIEALTIKKEGNSLEFKESTGQLDRSMETLCAFLNGEGGTILYGVKDDGKIIGQTVSDSTKTFYCRSSQSYRAFCGFRNHLCCYSRH